jgi:hypothetical protein
VWLVEVVAGDEAIRGQRPSDPPFQATMLAVQSFRNFD